MASTSSLEASEIRRRGRRRLLGAVTLVLLLVVFVPMILDSEPRNTRSEPSLAIPPRENAPPLPAPAPASRVPTASLAATEATASPATPGATAAPAAPIATPPAESVKPAVVEPVAPAAAKPQPAPAPAAPPKLVGFAVQVGAFRDEARLKQARDKLKAAGIVHYTERVAVANGTITRLRAGPFPTREAAERAKGELKKAALDGQVVPLP